MKLIELSYPDKFESEKTLIGAVLFCYNLQLDCLETEVGKSNSGFELSCPVRFGSKIPRF